MNLKKLALVSALCIGGGTVASAMAPVTPIYVNTEGQKNTYQFSISNLAPAAAATDLLTICGSSTKTIKIAGIRVSGSATTATNADFMLIVRSAVDTGGTPTNLVPVAADPTVTSAATATLTTYAGVATVGTPIGQIRSAKAALPIPVSAEAPLNLLWEFGVRNDKEQTLRGSTQCLAINWNTQTVAGAVISIDGVFTEE